MSLMPKVAVRPLTRCLVGAALGTVTLLGMMSTGAQAQSADRPDPLADFQTKDGADFFNGRGNGNGAGSVMNFIQNAIIGVPRDAGEFAAEQKDNLDSETARFRAQQAEQFRKLQVNPTSDVAPLETLPSVATPRATPLQ